MSIACAFALAFLGCGERAPGSAVDFRHNREGTGTPVATFGKDSVTAEELQARLEEMSPFMRPRYQTVEQREEYVDGIVRFELLVAEAERRGLHNHPEVVDAAKKVMVQKLLSQQLDEKPSAVPEEEARAYYDRHLSNFVKPQMVRLSHVFVAAPNRQLAEQVQEKAAAAPPMDYQAFALLVRAHSEEPRSKPLDGDLRYLSEDELSTQYGAAVAEAARSLKSVGEVSGVVETDGGFHVLKLQGRQAALDLSFQEVKPQIVQNLVNEKRTARFNALLEELKQRAAVKVDAQALGKIQVDLKAPAKAPQGPAPVVMPAPGAR